ncbi:MAG: hypothetical protein VXZ72_00600 [Chlamydiota bacterium]|nr:hypothetical protein [Chlamydiota bacterium]
MYAYGCYSLKGYEMEALYSFDYVLSDTDVALQEVVDPLINVYNAYKLGKLPLYPAREKFRKLVNWIEHNSPYALSYLPDWSDIETNGVEALFDVFLEEEKSWSIFTTSAMLHDAMLCVKEHGLDPFVLYLAAEKHQNSTDTTVIVDWYCNDYIVVRSPFVGKRKPVEPAAGSITTCDAEAAGDEEAYVMPPDFVNSVMDEFVESLRYNMFHRNHHELLRGEQKIPIEVIVEEMRNEFGYIPGELNSRNIGLPDHSRSSGVDIAHFASR